ncbi:MAG: DUF370 domain-containing protein [Negativicutes bacterium]|nr:DUF370 domain-containing protein [Negativicutes bacterium]
MYLHIGGEYSISTRMIVGIFDLDQITQTKDKGTVFFLSDLEEKSLLEAVSPDLPRSLVLTLDRAYLSPISTATLRQRLIDQQIDWSITMT